LNCGNCKVGVYGKSYVLNNAVLKSHQNAGNERIEWINNGKSLLEGLFYGCDAV
jgi:hypothetical protein